MESIHDVIVVGGGLSGLYAASLLHERGEDVLVLESRNRIAGRQWTDRSQSFVSYVDLGGAYIGQRQTKVLEVASKLGLEFFKIASNLKNVFYLQGTKFCLVNGVPLHYNPLVFLDVNHLSRSLDKLSMQIPRDDQVYNPLSRKLDHMTVTDFLDENAWTRLGHCMISSAVKCVFVAEPRNISLLHLLRTIRRCGGFRALISIENGLQEMKIKGGSASLSEGLANSITDRVLLNCHVTEIRQLTDVAQLNTKDGRQFHGKRVIVAVPLPILQQLTFQPPLPDQLLKVASFAPECHCIKTVAYYKDTFWRTKGYSGEMLTDDGPIVYCVDDTKPDGTYPAIMGFINGDEADKYGKLTKKERQNLVCEQYARGFGMDEFLEPVAYIEKDWADEEEMTSGQGCCVYSTPPGIMSAHQSNIFRRHGLVHFAGTETATEFFGYMDGALQAGQRAAAEVLQQFGHTGAKELIEKNQDIPYLPVPWIEILIPSVPAFLVISASLLVLCFGVAYQTIL